MTAAYRVSTPQQTEPSLTRPLVRRPWWRCNLLLNVTFAMAVGLSLAAFASFWLGLTGYGDAGSIVLLLLAWYIGFQFIPKRGRRGARG